MAEVFLYHADIMQDHSCFEGHFPSFPVFPAVGQLALLQQAIEAYHKKACEIIALPMIKFLQPIVPDTQLVIELDIQEHGNINFIMASEHITFAKGKLRYRIKDDGE